MHEWANHLEKKGVHIADAGRGRPSFPSDLDAVTAMYNYAKHLKKSREVALYGTSVLGEKHYREQAAEGFFKEYGIHFPTYEIMLTPGGQFAIAATSHLVKELNGGAIITPKPWYVNHEAIMSLYSKIVPIDEMSACSKIGAFLFCNPSNPQGIVWREEDWKKMLPMLEKYDVPIILDEAFAEIVFDKNYRISLIHAAPHLADRIIIMRSGTKALGLSGERLHVLRVPKKYMPIIEEFQSRLIGNCPLSVQAGMAAAFQNMTHEKKAAISDYYKKNADYLLDEVGDLLVGERPQGGFYFLANFGFMLGQKMPEAAKAAYTRKKDLIEDDIDVSMALMFGYGQKPNTGLGTVPGSCFGVDKNLGHVRISFSSEMANLKRIAAQINQAKQFRA